MSGYDDLESAKHAAYITPMALLCVICKLFTLFIKNNIKVVLKYTESPNNYVSLKWIKNVLVIP